MPLAALTAHGSLVTVWATVVVTAVTWAVVPVALDPRRLLGWLLGLLTAGAGLTWMLGW